MLKNKDFNKKAQYSGLFYILSDRSLKLTIFYPFKHSKEAIFPPAHAAYKNKWLHIIM